MKRKFLHYLSITLIFLMLFVLTSCFFARDVKEIRMKDDSVIEMTVGDFSYEGKKVILVGQNGSETEIDLQEAMIPEVERLKFYKIGEHDVNVYYTSKIFTTMKIKVNRRDFDDVFELEDATYVYDGQAHKMELNKKLPDGASIDYIYGNSFTEAGEYDVVAVMTKDGYNPKTLNGKLVIEKAEYDTSAIKFDNLTTTYDGNAKMISITGLPEGVKVTYEIYDEAKKVKFNSAINAGTYKVVATFSDTNRNYVKLDDMEATLTINKAIYDMSYVEFIDATKEYDGLNYEPKLEHGSLLPEGVSVEYKCYKDDKLVESNAEAGTYKMVAEFKGDYDNYEEIEPMEATLTVDKKLVVISNIVSIESQTVNYDRKEHALELVNADLLEEKGVTYTFKNNNQTQANEYKVTVTFEINDENSKLDVEQMVAYLIINKIEENVMVLDETSGQEREVSVSDVYIENNTTSRALKIKGLDLEKYIISKCVFYEVVSQTSVSINELENGKQYEYTISFNYVDPVDNRSVTLSPLSGVITYTTT